MKQRLSEKRTKRLLMALSGLLLAGCMMVSWDYYFNPQYQLRIKYPKNWIMTEGILDSMVTFTAPGKKKGEEFHSNVSIVVQDLTNKAETLKNYTDSLMKHLKIIVPTAKMFDTSEVKFGKYPGFRMVYEIKGGGKELKFYQMITIYKNKAFILTYTAEKRRFERSLKIVKSMVESFEFVDGP